MAITYTWANADSTQLKYVDDSTTPDTIKFVPVATGNRDYKAYLASGITAEPYTDPAISSLPEAKTLASSAVQSKAYSLLLPTDWMVIREIETNVSVPDEITTYRAAVRAEANAKTTKIDSKAKLSTLQTYVNSEEFETWPTQGASAAE